MVVLNVLLQSHLLGPASPARTHEQSRTGTISRALYSYNEMLMNCKWVGAVPKGIECIVWAFGQQGMNGSKARNYMDKRQVQL